MNQAWSKAVGQGWYDVEMTRFLISMENASLGTIGHWLGSSTTFGVTYLDVVIHGWSKKA